MVIAYTDLSIHLILKIHKSQGSEPQVVFVLMHINTT